MVVATVGVVRIRRDKTTWDCDAFSIENLDGNNETVMFWMEDWEDLLRAIEQIKPFMREKE